MSLAWLQITVQQQKSSGDPSAAGMEVKWQPGSKIQFINVTTVTTAAQRPGQQCGGSRTAVQVFLGQR